MIHKRSTALERSVKIFYWRAFKNQFHGANLAPNSDLDQDTFGKNDETQHTRQLRALSQQVTTKLQGTDTTVYMYNTHQHEGITKKKKKKKKKKRSTKESQVYQLL